MTKMTRGIDTSLWEGGEKHDQVMDWSAYTWDFAFIKASEGLVLDPLFKKQWAAARGRAIRGAYHFLRPSVDPKESVRKTIQSLDGDLGELPIALDLEVTDEVAGPVVVERVKSWLAWYEQDTGVRPIIYSRSTFLRDTLQAYKYSWLSNYTLWLAQYPFDKMEPIATREQLITDILNGIFTPSLPILPLPFKRLAFWQWTAQGKPESVPGYYMGYGHKKEVDLNFYTGTREQMIEEFEISDLPDIQPIPGGTMEILYYADLKADLVSRVRSEAGLAASIVKSITGPVTVSIVSEKIIRDGYDWYQITAPESGYIALTTQYTNFRPADTEPIPTPAEDEPKKITIEMQSGAVWSTTIFTRES